MTSLFQRETHGIIRMYAMDQLATLRHDSQHQDRIQSIIWVCEELPKYGCQYFGRSSHSHTQMIVRTYQNLQQNGGPSPPTPCFYAGRGCQCGGCQCCCCSCSSYWKVMFILERSQEATSYINMVNIDNESYSRVGSMNGQDHEEYFRWNGTNTRRFNDVDMCSPLYLDTKHETDVSHAARHEICTKTSIDFWYVGAMSWMTWPKHTGNLLMS